MWANATDTVRISLIKQKVHFSMLDMYADVIVGWHLYKSGNTIIESNYAYNGTPFNNGHSSILGGNDNGNNILECQMDDISKWNKNFEVTLTLNATQNQLTWRSTEHSGMHVYGNPQHVPPAGLTLPRNMVLIKQ